MKKRPDKAETQAWVARRRSLMERLESRFAELDQGLRAVEQQLKDSGLDSPPANAEPPQPPRKPR